MESINAITRKVSSKLYFACCVSCNCISNPLHSSLQGWRLTLQFSAFLTLSTFHALQPHYDAKI
ncbi:uncharacterized protein PHALS_14955 [Plasmopara halstedii]|uniref:Uncharacterized protein n=1 Tax=Plasmopara halstedii TaxID=4781 RepID=A0A0P1AZR0_PLAHL|nr:uncharacterized protein PHALS_14955 [Plasmopara halstedii]CEG47046.1 hypothetical protein PHALS_14955 [Plasmopara halstedii]|eukprot:XP_024583415.1 hypothetical protein PHALS_14955 [Plasmopara halstedii]